MRYAWKGIDHIVSVNGEISELQRYTPGAPMATITRPSEGRRTKSTILLDHPVDLLVVGTPTQVSKQGDKMTGTGPTFWETWVDKAGERKPRAILEVWPKESLWVPLGPLQKLAVTRWSNRGYQTRGRYLEASTIGGAISQEKLVVLRMASSLADDWTWPETYPGSSEQASGRPTTRPMANLLRPSGLVPKRCWQVKPDHKGKEERGAIPCAESEALPERPGSLIRTDRGIRRILNDEIAKGLGVPREWMAKDETNPYPSEKLLNLTTAIFFFEYLAPLIYREYDQSTTTAPELIHPESTNASLTTPHSRTAIEHPFEWRPPDLSVGADWYERRVQNLRAAALTTEDPDLTIQEGLEALRKHRRNYTAEGPAPQELQLLWWEFPQEHWEALREGSKMNFLIEPGHGIHPNSEMDPGQMTVAEEFVTELIDLGVLRPARESEVRTTAPLFCLPKEGQPGQWRIISDMKASGQNEAIANDPVFLPRPINILPLLYEGGFSAVVDASKFFYQFKTHPDDQPYLGVVHPRTHDLYVYTGLPMGGGNSPALAGRYGLAFLRLLRKRYEEEYGGVPNVNCWWTGFRPTGEYHPRWGHGYVLLDEAGIPAVKVWVHVDDFLLHGPNQLKTNRALSSFLDLTVEVGLLCHPKKLTPPSQVVKYCGFLIDTTGIPCLRIPQAKRERAAAMVEVVHHKVTRQQPMSRLALSVVTGTLEALADATPRRLGHTYLRHLHEALHDCELSGVSLYFSNVTLPTRLLPDLAWWDTALRRDVGRHARGSSASVLIPMWGDGSGTGSGGTIVIPYGVPDASARVERHTSVPPMDMWMSTWSNAARAQTSNWKELRTVLTSMQCLSGNTSRPFPKGATVFYFTDNMVTYFILRDGASRIAALHALVVEIRRLELTMDVFLEVVHVPGLAMIDQGTDGLSRGIWATSLHARAPHYLLTAAVFAPVIPTPPIHEFLKQLVGHTSLRNPAWTPMDFSQLWDPNSWLDVTSVWFPPPELGAELISRVLETWVERPLSTAAVFVIPRILQSSWMGLSRHVRVIGEYRPHDMPPQEPTPLLPVPIVVLFLPCFHRTLTPLSVDARLDSTSRTPGARWHRQQATSMRGVQPLPLSD